tara:strand:+ start:36 stop:293 length:258 start_codon:yes stop_codon:yes gene_type:complete
MDKEERKANRDLRKNARTLYKDGAITKEQKKEFKKPGIPTIKKGEVFKAHMMYKDCEEVMAETMKKHLSLKKKGYNHKKSKNCEK